MSHARAEIAEQPFAPSGPTLPGMRDLLAIGAAERMQRVS